MYVCVYRKGWQAKSLRHDDTRGFMADSGQRFQGHHVWRDFAPILL